MKGIAIDIPNATSINSGAINGAKTQDVDVAVKSFLEPFLVTEWVEVGFDAKASENRYFW